MFSYVCVKLILSLSLNFLYVIKDDVGRSRDALWKLWKCDEYMYYMMI